MARVTRAAITFNDLIFMVENEGFPEIQEIPASQKCMTKEEIQTYTIINESNVTAYGNNRLVPYSRLEVGLYATVSELNISNLADDGTFTLFCPNGFSSTVSEPWITIEPTGGVNTSELITWTSQENATASPRTATITFSDGSNASWVVTVNQSAGTGIIAQPITATFGTTSSIACSSQLSGTFYIPNGESWETATALYNDAQGTVNAAARWYASGGVARQWSGAVFIGSNVNCI